MNAHLDIVGVLPVTLVIADVPMCPGAINAGTFFRILKDADHQAVPAVGSLQPRRPERVGGERRWRTPAWSF